MTLYTRAQSPGIECYGPQPTRDSKREPSALESAVATLTDEQQQVYWCMDMAGEAGLTDSEGMAMTCLYKREYVSARERLFSAGLIYPANAGEIIYRWAIVPEGEVDAEDLSGIMGGRRAGSIRGRAGMVSDSTERMRRLRRGRNGRRTRGEDGV